jgi:hypothetical protein
MTDTYKERATMAETIIDQTNANGWLPIETAPKDGRPLRLAGQWLSGNWDITVGSWLASRFNFSGQGQPTHWMPLPPSPESKP